MKISESRYRQMYEMRISGKTFIEIGIFFNLSREAIRQSLKRRFGQVNKPQKNKYEYKCSGCGNIIFRYVDNKNYKFYCNKDCKPIITKEDIQRKERIRRKKYYETVNGKEIIKSLNRKNYIKNKEKSMARSAVNQAIKKGTLIKPEICSICNKHSKRIEGHHNDYKNKLHVIWVCTPCHNLIHTKKIDL